MSNERSSSAVRNLRSIFENKASADQSPNSRGRSTAGLSTKEYNRPTSKVRASFVSVEPAGGMADVAETDAPELTTVSSAGVRRGSFDAGVNGGDVSELRKTVSQEADKREQNPNVSETIPETAVESPAGASQTPDSKVNAKEGEAIQKPLPPQEASKAAEEVVQEPSSAQNGIEELKEPANPDKPTTAAEEEPSSLKPAEPANEEAVSKGEALPPVTEDLRPKEQQESAQKPEEPTPAPAGKPQRIHEDKPSENAHKPVQKPTIKTSTSGRPSSVKAPPKPTPSVKSPTTPVAPNKKGSRSSLTAPTAASMARSHGGEHPPAASGKHSPPSKPKPKEATKPVDLPSRLTAPTAAYRAKHEADPKPSNSVNAKAPATTRPKPASAKPTPRSSLAPGQKPESTASATSKKPAPQPNGSFLERMTRPTAASASKTHEKVDVKSPPQKAAVSPKPKTNGHAKKPAATSKASSRPGTAKSQDATIQEHSHEPVPDHTAASKSPEAQTEGPKDATEAGEAADATEGVSTGNETPQTNGEIRETLEATPAFGGAEIR